MAWLAQDSSFSEVLKGIVAGQEAFHGDETEFPINTWTRVDLLGMVAKPLNWVPDDLTYLLGMLALLAIPCLAIRQIVDREIDKGVTGLSGLIAILTILLSIYHHSYDCLLLALPWFGLVFFPNKVVPEMGAVSKRSMSLLLAVPLFNYFSTQTARNLLGIEQSNWIWQFVTVINGVCILAVFMVVLIAAWRTAVSHTIQRDFGR